VLRRLKKSVGHDIVDPKKWTHYEETKFNIFGYLRHASLNFLKKRRDYEKK